MMRQAIIWVSTLAAVGGLVVGSGSCMAGSPGESRRSGNVRIVRSLGVDWRFIIADAQGAERPGCDDTAWRKVDVPHDWSIAGPFDVKDRTKPASLEIGM